MIGKIQLTDFKNSLYPIFSLHVCTKFITDLYRRALRLLEKSSPRRAPVYKGFSKNLALDEANQTKRMILPEPFVLENRQRVFFHQKALISDEHVSFMWIFVHLGAFLPSNRFLFLPWQGTEQTKKNSPSETGGGRRRYHIVSVPGQKSTFITPAFHHYHTFNKYRS